MTLSHDEHALTARANFAAARSAADSIAGLTYSLIHQLPVLNLTDARPSDEQDYNMCPECGFLDRLRLIEDGYCRSNLLHVDVDPDVGELSVWAVADGLDDFTDDGSFPSVVICDNCDAIWQCPDELEWA